MIFHNYMDQNSSSPQINKTKHNGIGIDILWVLVILAGFLFFTSLIPLPPNDFWWHLKIGESIYITHSIPTTNIYAWSLPVDQPFFYAAWLGELLLYGLRCHLWLLMWSSNAIPREK